MIILNGKKIIFISVIFGLLILIGLGFFLFCTLSKNPVETSISVTDDYFSYFDEDTITDIAKKTKAISYGEEQGKKDIEQYTEKVIETNTKKENKKNKKSTSKYIKNNYFVVDKDISIDNGEWLPSYTDWKRG